MKGERWFMAPMGVALVLAACTSETPGKHPGLEMPPVELAATSAPVAAPPLYAVLEALPLELPRFAAALCPYPEGDHETSYQLANATSERARCLEDLRRRQLRESLGIDADFWGALEEAIVSWQEARCTVDEWKHWVELSTREWSDGTAWGLRQDRCLQRMYEERIFFGEARRLDLDAFWELVEARQDAGRKVRASLGELHEQASRDPVPGEGIGPLRPGMWSDFVDYVEQALVRPRALAARHCARMEGPPDCVDKLALYFHSIGADAEELDLWRIQRPGREGLR